MGIHWEIKQTSWYNIRWNSRSFVNGSFQFHLSMYPCLYHIVILITSLLPQSTLLLCLWQVACPLLWIIVVFLIQLCSQLLLKAFPNTLPPSPPDSPAFSLCHQHLCLPLQSYLLHSVVTLFTCLYSLSCQPSPTHTYKLRKVRIIFITCAQQRMVLNDHLVNELYM